MKVSVIMPLYNAEKFLRESLDSVLLQEMTDLELICINDASTDSTLEIMMDYRRIDNRIKILSNELHSGAAFSRNKGMKIATGEYITFLDGDDIFEPDLLSESYHAAVKYDADIVDFQYKAVPSDKIREKVDIMHSAVYKEKFCRGVFSVGHIKPCEFMNCHSGPCRLFRRRFVEKEGLEFQDLSNCNDVFFVNMALTLANKIHFLDNEKVMLHVRQHNTPSRISFKRDPMCAYQADKKTIEELMRRNQMDNVYKQIYYRIYCHLLITLQNINEEKTVREFYEFLQKQGIGDLTNTKFFPLLDCYIQEGFYRFQNEDFASGWYKEEGELTSYLYEYESKVQDLFDFWEENHKKVGVWGAGQNGRIFLKFCREHHCNIEAVIDCDEKKHGDRISGFTSVCFPEEVCDRLQVIILTSSNLVHEVSRMVEEKQWKLELCDINLFLGK